jgi:fructose-1,6-bisphosphatase-3
LASHLPFESTLKAIEEELDIHSKTEIVETNRARLRVKDTDLGRAIQKQSDDLQRLLSAYRAGLVKEK